MRNKIRVFIVEDNEDERIFMKEGFINSGLFDITGEARNGDEMLEILAAEEAGLPDVIISDLNMPGKNGYEVIMDIKGNNQFSHIPVVILTTAPLKPYAERCKRLGACAYYTKPDTFLEYEKFADEIFDDLNECLKNARLQFTADKEVNSIRNWIANISSLLFRPSKAFVQ
jgi:CheY-like chemotaxis protein